MRDDDLTTAHAAWDSRWSEESGRAAWLEAEQFVVDTIPFLKERNVERVLDLGCGPGRHALLLARHGFETRGIDASRAGIEYARASASEAGLQIDFREGSYLELPYPDSSFGYVLAWNVIYHGDRDTVLTALREIERVLLPGGIIQGTMLSKRHNGYGKGTEIRPNTFVQHDEDEKAHPHFYCNGRELVQLLADFELTELRDRQQRETDDYHWEFIAEKRAT